MTIGIYILRFKGTDKVYVGQSLRIEERFSKHNLRLTNGIANYKLQTAYNQYGYPYLEILIEADINEDLDSLENEAIEIFDSVSNGFNINSKASGGGTGLQGDKHGNSRYSNASILKVFKLLIQDINSFSKISEVTNVSIHTIRDISKGKCHKWLSNIDQDSYDLMLSKIGTRVKNTLEDSRDVLPVLINGTKEVQISNISEFARLNGLNKSHISGVISGKRLSHKGWTIK